VTDHLPGKLENQGKVKESKIGQGKVRENVKSQGMVRKLVKSRKSQGKIEFYW